jgi:phytoene dehydrogenase-like protein
MMREARRAPSSSTRSVPIVIVGGGIAGLSAAWALQRHGYTDFEILELEDEVGGNSRSGRNAVSAYPWGAHYVPVPGKDAELVRLLFRELGVISGDEGGKPIFREDYLCAAPEERLFRFGRWEEHLLPQVHLAPGEAEEHARFLSLMQEYSQSRGNDGRVAFTIPIELSSSDIRFRALDEMSMAAFLERHHFRSETLRWYVDYCCLDDYGAPAERVSAWAGVHYFASREPWAANVHGYQLLTWPEGNGWIVNSLRQKLAPHIRTKRLVLAIESVSAEPLLSVLDFESGTVEVIRAKTVIYAAPRFTAPYVIAELRKGSPAYLDDFVYHPWMVANVTLEDLPADSKQGFAWDNVIYQSRSLGYVDAAHQELGRREKPTVITYYLPLASADPAAARKEAQAQPWEYWRDLVVSDLEVPHPGISALIRSIDVWLWGHGMIAPSPGFVWGTKRQQALQPLGSVYFAHSDMSGISIFEEAQYRGVYAAESALRRQGRRFEGLAV